MTKLQQNQLNYLVHEMFTNIAILYLPSGRIEWILYSYYEASYSNSAASVDFTMFKGINITGFIESCAVDPFFDKGSFNNLFNSFKEYSKEYTVKLNKNIEYVTYTI